MIRIAILIFLAALPLAAEDADVDALIAKLGSVDSETRDKATDELVRLGDTAEKRLRERLNDPDAEVRARIAAVLEEVPKRRLRETTLEPLREIRATGGVVTHLAWSPDGKRLACCDDRSAVAIWDVAAREIVQDLQSTRPDGQVDEADAVRCLAWSPDGKDLWQGTSSSLVCWEAESGRQKSWTDAGARVITFSRDGRRVAWCDDSAVLVAAAGKPDAFVKTVAFNASHACLRFDDAGTTLVAAFAEGILWRIDALTGEKQDSSTGDPSYLTWDSPRVSWLDGEGRMILGEGELSFPRSGAKLDQFVSCVSVAASGQRVAAILENQVVLVFDDAGKELERHELPGPACETAWSPDGASLAVAISLLEGTDGRIAVFSGERCVVLPGGLKRAHQLAFSPDADLLAWRTEFWDDEVFLRAEAHVVHLDTGNELVLPNAHVSPGLEKSQFVALRENTLTLFDGRNGNSLERLWRSKKGLPQGRVALDAQGRFAWVGDVQGQGSLLCRYDPRKRIRVLESFTAPRAEWSPDGKLLAISSWAGRSAEEMWRVTVLDQDGKVRFDETGNVGSIAWTPDGAQLFLFDGDSCRALDAGTLTEVSRRDARVRHWRFIGPDAAIGTGDGKASLWSVPTMTAVKTWDIGRVRELAVSRDGSRVAFGLDNSIRIERFVRR